MPTQRLRTLVASADGNATNLHNSLLGKYYMSIRTSNYSRPTPFEPSKNKIKKTILLPLPQELRDDTNVQYNNVELGSVGDLINGDISSGIGAAVLRNSGALSESAVSGLSDLFGASGVGATINNILPADQITTAIQQATGTAPNPNPSVQFQGPTLREFAWTWTLLPVNETESIRIRKLVSTLKAAALPRQTVDNAGALLNYPDMCQLNFYPWDISPGSNDWGWGENSIIKLKKCMISYVNALYTPSNTPAFFKDVNSSPVTVQLSIGFKEIEYLLSEDWGGEGGLYSSTTNAVGSLLGSASIGALNKITSPLQAAFNAGGEVADAITGDTG